MASTRRGRLPRFTARPTSSNRSSHQEMCGKMLRSQFRLLREGCAYHVGQGDDSNDYTVVLITFEISQLFITACWLRLLALGTSKNSTVVT